MGLTFKLNGDIGLEVMLVCMTCGLIEVLVRIICLFGTPCKMFITDIGILFLFVFMGAMGCWFLIIW